LQSYRFLPQSANPTTENTQGQEEKVAAQTIADQVGNLPMVSVLFVSSVPSVVVFDARYDAGVECGEVLLAIFPAAFLHVLAPWRLFLFRMAVTQSA
jgi:hypothetical protein